MDTFWVLKDLVGNIASNSPKFLGREEAQTLLDDIKCTEEESKFGNSVARSCGSDI